MAERERMVKASLRVTVIVKMKDHWDETVTVKQVRETAMREGRQALMNALGKADGHGTQFIVEDVVETNVVSCERAR
jgi:hypothetical protein